MVHVASRNLDRGERGSQPVIVNGGNIIPERPFIGRGA